MDTIVSSVASQDMDTNVSDETSISSQEATHSLAKKFLGKFWKKESHHRPAAEIEGWVKINYEDFDQLEKQKFFENSLGKSPCVEHLIDIFNEYVLDNSLQSNQEEVQGEEKGPAMFRLKGGDDQHDLLCVMLPYGPLPEDPSMKLVTSDWVKNLFFVNESIQHLCPPDFIIVRYNESSQQKRGSSLQVLESSSDLQCVEEYQQIIMTCKKWARKGDISPNAIKNLFQLRHNLGENLISLEEVYRWAENASKFVNLFHKAGCTFVAPPLFCVNMLCIGRDSGHNYLLPSGGIKEYAKEEADACKKKDWEYYAIFLLALLRVYATNNPMDWRIELSYASQFQVRSQEESSRKNFALRFLNDKTDHAIEKATLNEDIGNLVSLIKYIFGCGVVDNMPSSSYEISGDTIAKQPFFSKRKR